MLQGLLGHHANLGMELVTLNQQADVEFSFMMFYKQIYKKQYVISFNQQMLLK